MAAAGVTSATRQCMAWGTLQGQAHLHFLFSSFFLFFLIRPVQACNAFSWSSLFLAACGLSCFSTHTLHIPSRIDRREPSGIAILAPPSSTGILARRKLWAERAPALPSSTGMLTKRSTWRPPCCDAGIPPSPIGR